MKNPAVIVLNTEEFSNMLIEKMIEYFKIQPITIENEIVDAMEAARLLNIQMSSLYGKVYRKEIPCIKRGNRLYFKVSDIDVLWEEKGVEKKMKAKLEKERLEKEADQTLVNTQKQIRKIKPV